jgi:hypothetical protein|tara:strand:+ start:382 stop:1062 length:681 start_codon:yes stop_codon:yes gene_type:complete
MEESKKFLPPIPDGYQIFEKSLEVAGVTHREKACERFARGQQQSLRLEPEPSNRHDKSAIRIIGVWIDSSGKEQSTLVGYVDRDVAKILTQNGYVPSVLPRLISIFPTESTYEDNPDYTWVGISYQILGPKGGLKDYAYHAFTQGGQTRKLPNRRSRASSKAKVRKTDDDEEEMSTLGCIWYFGTLVFAFSVIVSFFQEWSLWAAIPAALLVGFIWLRYVGGFRAD